MANFSYKKGNMHAFLDGMTSIANTWLPLQQSFFESSTDKDRLEDDVKVIREDFIKSLGIIEKK